MASSTSLREEYVTKPNPRDRLQVGSLITWGKKTKQLKLRNSQLGQRGRVPGGSADEGTHHTVREAPPFLKMGPQTLFRRLKAQTSDKKLSELLRFSQFPVLQKKTSSF